MTTDEAERIEAKAGLAYPLRSVSWLPYKASPRFGDYLNEWNGDAAKETQHTTTGSRI